MAESRSSALVIERVIRAPRQLVWDAWVDPENLAKWWLPAPYRCRVLQLDVRPGGAFETEMSDGGDFGPHLDACFLDVAEGDRIVFTTALVGGWIPADRPFITITAIITLIDHPQGTLYRAEVHHQNPAERDRHEELGFFEGWGTCLGQLQRLVEARIQ